jgi:hypothetical protein
MRRRPPRILTQRRLLYCILINQLATPGLGSLMARRFVSGAGLLLLALAGFSLSTVWMFQLCYALIVQQLDQPEPPRAPDWLWTGGLMLFGAGWCWALITSVGLYLEAQRLKPDIAADPPPQTPVPSGKSSRTPS